MTLDRFYLVESNVLPADRSGFRTSLQEGETFETDFIGASLEDCQSWALEKQSQVNFIEYDLITVVDARSAQDKTVLMSHYALPDNLEFSYAPAVDTAFNYGPFDLVYPAYFGRKEDFTDERGVFNVAEAERFYNPANYYINTPKL